MLYTSAYSAAAAALALAIFATPRRLSGPFLYDDKAAVLRNPVVVGAAPLEAAWTRDFWGEHELRDPQSHKSWRPLVTLSYRANFVLAGNQASPWGFHAVNAALHAFAVHAPACFHAPGATQLYHQSRQQ